jgi:hypothetical protein
VQQKRGVEVSLMERLHDLGSGIPMITLEEQYWMVSSICKVVPTVFYGGQLRTADCLPNMSVWNLGCYRSEVRLMWIHVKHDEHSLTPGGGDLTNNGEPPTSGSAYAVGWTSFAIFRKRPTQHAITSIG